MMNDSERVWDSTDLNNIVITRPNVVYANTEQEVLVITKDKLHLCLQQSFRRIAGRDRWLIPLGVLVPLVLTVVTSGFTKRFGIGGGEWETVFVILTIFTVIWLVYAWFQRGKSITSDEIIEELAKNPVKLGKTNSVDAYIGHVDTSTQAESQQASGSLIVPQAFEDDADTDTFADVYPSAGKSQSRSVPVLSPGDMVTHDKFGLGTVISTEGYNDQAEAKIDFGADWGVKHLVLRYAPLAKL